ncbi:hypothetical protein E5P55_00385 [Candidatus Pinguicoccus supinus]|uniref:Topo IIA-type catalytic domain-containing protein n=1 Tax=Candidatus Pinguicoccus supinus TaxID=2529394 RepID=A0A7T0BRU4_9BACT|nr:hypothetical protein E5P55_00385 [Candidatus Pinguicoccus supinus]
MDAQGNFGSPDGDSPAAYRYTECRLSKLSSFLFENIKENVGGFSLNYRQNLLEPKILPTLLPNILLNGTLGIAVGLISSIPSHNINEVFNAILVYIITGSLKQNLFIKLIPGPDFQLKSILKS